LEPVDRAENDIVRDDLVDGARLEERSDLLGTSPYQVWYVFDPLRSQRVDVDGVRYLSGSTEIHYDLPMLRSHLPGQPGRCLRKFLFGPFCGFPFELFHCFLAPLPCAATTRTNFDRETRTDVPPHDVFGQISTSLDGSKILVALLTDEGH